MEIMKTSGIMRALCWLEQPFSRLGWLEEGARFECLRRREVGGERKISAAFLSRGELNVGRLHYDDQERGRI